MGSEGGSPIMPREYYTAMLAVQKDLQDMERRIMEELQKLASREEVEKTRAEVKINAEDIVEMRITHARADKIWASVTALGTLGMMFIKDYISGRR